MTADVDDDSLMLMLKFSLMYFCFDTGIADTAAYKIFARFFYFLNSFEVIDLTSKQDVMKEKCDLFLTFTGHQIVLFFLRSFALMVFELRAFLQE